MMATLLDVTTSREDAETSPDDGCCGGPTCDLLPEADADSLATVFKALADPTRVRLLRYLAQSDAGTACACHLPSALGITQPTLSFHMAKLHDAGLVTRDKRGRWVHWTVQPATLASVRAFLDLPIREDGAVDVPASPPAGNGRRTSPQPDQGDL